MTLPPVGTAHGKARYGDPDFVERCEECGRILTDDDEGWVCTPCRADEEASDGEAKG